MPKKLDCRLKKNKSKKSCVNKTKSSKRKIALKVLEEILKQVDV